VSAIHAPHLFINKYLQEKIAVAFDTATPFLPSVPTNIEDLTNFTVPRPSNAIDFLTESVGVSNDGTFAVYDRMFKMRRTPFPHIKLEQLMYYFYATTGIEILYDTQQLVQDLLDRGDESAQDLNSWIYEFWVAQGSPITTGTDLVTQISQEHNAVNFGSDQNPKWILLPYFHEIKIFQLEETRDIIDFGTARTWAGNKIIIDYQWHSS
jgi:hypothetical protein